MAVGDLVQPTAAGRRLRQVRVGLRRAPVVPLVILAVIVFSALLAEALTPYSPTKVFIQDRLLPPFWMAGGSWAHPLGTDDLGRDLFTRMLYGARISLIVAVLTVLASGSFGTAWGLASGYYGGAIDHILMRVADATMAFPIILFAILLVAVLQGGLFTVVVAIATVLWARYARVIRGEVVALRERDFIAAARVAGCSGRRIMLRHLLPNVLNTLVVLFTLQVGWVIIVEASLSFLGAGIPPPTPAWGQMISEGREYTTTAWWLSFFPGMAILLTVLSFNLFGDWLRDTLDPKLRQV